MVRNDYKRSLILLRGNAAGYSGHVRLERRTLMGSMYFLVQSAKEGDGLQAALIGRSKNGYYACALGELRAEEKRQYSLSVNFDPRNICSRELEQYQLAVVLQRTGQGCRIVLFGNLNGHADIDWKLAEQAACGLFEGEKEALQLLPEQPAEEETAPALEEKERITESQPAESEAEEKMKSAAIELLNLDAALPWPEAVEGVKSLFESGEALEDVPDDDYVYISAPMPAQSGYDSCLIGLRAENGRLAGVSYALPALYSAEAPAGLEEYSWAGDNSRGWWVREINL